MDKFIIKFESEVKQILAEAKEEVMVKFESDAKKILTDFEVMAQYGPEKKDTKKSSDISGFFSKYFWSLFFLWLCLIIIAISLILIGKHYGPKQDNDRTGPTGSSIPIGLQIEGTSFLLLALTFPLIYRVSLIFQRIDPVLARYLRNLGWFLLFIELGSSLFLLFAFAFVAVVNISDEGKKIFFCIYSCTFQNNSSCHNVEINYLQITIPGCNEDYYCHVPHLFSLIFHLVALAIIALLGLINLCYCLVKIETADFVSILRRV